MKHFMFKKVINAILILIFFLFINSYNIFAQQVFLKKSNQSVAVSLEYNDEIFANVLLTESNVKGGESKQYKNEDNCIIPKQTQISGQFENVNHGDLAWADFNNDSLKDLLLTGITESEVPITKIYKNNGNGAFEELTNISLPGVWNSSVAWGDYNNDSFNDFIITGQESNTTGITKLYKNNGDGTFTEQTGMNFIQVGYSSVAFGDYDNDSDLDIIICGVNASFQVMTEIYKNNGNGTFTVQSSANIHPLAGGNVLWKDLNNDNYIDIIINGRDTVLNTCTKIYKNNQNGTFTEQTHNIQNIWGNTALGDYNNDDLPDILICGGYLNSNEDEMQVSKLYKNTGNFNFEETNVELDSISYGTVMWGDYNNDSLLDFIHTGFYLNNHQAKSSLYKNLGNGTFAKQTQIKLIDIGFSSSEWVDYNNDNNLDFILSGRHESGFITKLYTNTGIGNFYTPSTFQFPEEFTLNNSLSDTNVRKIKKVDFNNDNNIDIVTLSSGKFTFYKNNGAGSFIEQTQISVPKVSTDLTNYGVIGSINFGKFNNDDNLDFLIQGPDENGLPFSKVFLNTINNNFTEVDTLNIDDLGAGNSDWGDYNNDGYEDFIISGQTGNVYPYSKIYKNNGDNTFTEQNQILLTGVDLSSCKWGDYNNDNFIDILIAGEAFDIQNQTWFPISKVYKNNGDNTFSEQTQINLIGIEFANVAWGDYNNDGFSDILLSGRDENDIFINKIYKNNGNNTFSENTNVTFPQLYEGYICWADYNNDNFLDIMLVGKHENKIYFPSEIYKNNGDETFTKQIQINLPQAESCSWIDFNNDNYTDFLLGTNNGIKIFKNNGAGNFNEIVEKDIKNFTNIFNSSISAADFDKNSFPDFLTSGTTGQNAISELFYNTETEINKLNEASVILPDLQYGYNAWSDINNDGYLDIIQSGINNIGEAETNIYKNLGNRTFVSSNIPLLGIYKSFIDVADSDNDGDYDFIITGKINDNTYVTRIYINKANTFEEISAGLPPARKAVWGDFNLDGKIDILLQTNNDNFENNGIIFINKGNNTFEEESVRRNLGLNFLWEDYDNNGILDIISFSNDSIYIDYNSDNININSITQKNIYGLDINSNISMFDYDNNGTNDIVINGKLSQEGDERMLVFKNNGVNIIDAIIELAGTRNGSFDKLDYDNDGDLDIVFSGKSDNRTLGDTIYSGLYINNTTNINSKPTSPTNLLSRCVSDTVFLTWSKAIDNETNQNGLTYNCYMYEVGGDTIWHSLSNQKTGKRYITKKGNVQNNTSWFIANLDVNKMYAWSVQAVDNSFLAGDFAPEDTFRIAPKFLIQPITQTVCETGNITFNTSTTPATNYQWYIFSDNDTILIENNEQFSNATSSNLTITNSTLNLNGIELHCKATTIGGDTYSTAAFLYVDSLFLANAGNDKTVCGTTSFQLSAEGYQNNIGTWACNIQQVYFSDIHDANATVYNLPEGNTVFEWKITQGNVCGSNSDIVVITQNPDGLLPDKPSKPEGEINICKGSTSYISTEAVNNANSYFWEILPAEAGSIIENNKNVKINWSNNYLGIASIRVKAENECGGGNWSENINVEIKNIKANDIIQKSKTILLSVDSGYRYQWYFNGSVIPSANKQYYYSNDELKEGDYQIKIFFYDGCEKRSSVYSINHVQEKLFLDKTIDIFPNPAQNTITVKIDNYLTGKIKFTITDNIGIKRIEEILNKNKKVIVFDKDLFGLIPGSYNVEFLFNDDVKVTKHLIVK